MEFGIFEDGLIINHIENQALYYYRNENRLAEVEDLLKQPYEPNLLSYTHPKVETTKEKYEKAVEKAKEYINAGDIFQVVLSKRFQFKLQGSLIPLL